MERNLENLEKLLDAMCERNKGYALASLKDNLPDEYQLFSGRASAFHYAMWLCMHDELFNTTWKYYMEEDDNEPLLKSIWRNTND